MCGADTAGRVTLSMGDGIDWEQSKGAQEEIAGFAVRIDESRTGALVAFAPDLIGNYEVGGSPTLRPLTRPIRRTPGT